MRGLWIIGTRRGWNCSGGRRGERRPERGEWENNQKLLANLFTHLSRLFIKCRRLGKRRNSREDGGEVEG